MIPWRATLLDSSKCGKTPDIYVLASAKPILNSFPAINYEDPNLNVAIPVFSIHGNHDDPQGTGPVCSHRKRRLSLPFNRRPLQEGALCALDILAAAGVINYFGKVHLAANEEDPNDPNSSGIKIRPVLLQKGDTRLAMYGVGNVKDTRMHYELRSNRVRMFMPQEDNKSNWFNLLLVHQNRCVCELYMS